jgi:hypothetical protein
MRNITSALVMVFFAALLLRGATDYKVEGRYTVGGVGGFDYVMLTASPGGSTFRIRRRWTSSMRIAERSWVQFRIPLASTESRLRPLSITDLPAMAGRIRFRCLIGCVANSRG